jgi:uncharacterized protein (DUF1800 family)
MEMRQAVERGIALNRFGLGARAGEDHAGDARDWLMSQFEAYEAAPESLSRGLSSADILSDYAERIRSSKDLPAAERMEIRQALRKEGRANYRLDVRLRVASAVETSSPFIERLVHFWSNHFALSIADPLVTWLAGSFEREAIRPHVLGTFEEMLLAVETHPAMLLYLNQSESVGPNSSQAKRASEKKDHRLGLNENLAREILELHTLGVKAAYTQEDVIELALALTGWGRRIKGGAPVRDGDPYFAPVAHEHGRRVIMGTTYAQPGVYQGRAILRDLARSPHTARHIATKLARHFIGDDPPEAAIRALQTAFLDSGGTLPAVYETLIDRAEAWEPDRVKFKTPWEWLISSFRGLGIPEKPEMSIAAMLQQLGQPVWQPGSPAGYDDIAASWASPDALMKRVEVAQQLADSRGDLDPRDLALELLPGTLSDSTRQEIHRASTAQSGLVLLAVSPEFLRR